MRLPACTLARQVCGYVSHQDRSTHLNPPDTDQMHAGDRLIVLAHQGKRGGERRCVQAAPPRARHMHPPPCPRSVTREYCSFDYQPLWLSQRESAQQITPCPAGDLRPWVGAQEASLPSQDALQQRLQGAVASASCPKKIVVLGWRGEVADIAVSGQRGLSVGRWAGWRHCGERAAGLRCG